MAYKLKKNHERFIMVDGPFKGKEYVHGVSYEEVPPGEKHRFEGSSKLKGESSKLKAQSWKEKAVVVKKKDVFEGDKPATLPAGKSATQTAGKSAGVAGTKYPLTGRETKNRKG